jgi:hypothetical protein
MNVCVCVCVCMCVRVCVCVCVLCESNRERKRGGRREIQRGSATDRACMEKREPGKVEKSGNYLKQRYVETRKK